MFTDVAAKTIAKRRSRAWAHAVAALLLALYWVMAVSALRHKSATSDEVAHLTAGYSYWITDDIRLQPENGILPQRWAALPLLWSRPTFPSLDSDDWHKSDVWAMARQFLYASGHDADRLMLQGRAMIALVTVALGGLVYGWSLRLWGPAGGLLSVALFAFCPTMLSHGAMVTSDATAALLFLATVTCAWRVFHRVTPGRLALSLLACGLLFVAKFSAPLVVPMLVLLAVVRVVRGGPLVVRLPAMCRRITGRMRQAGVLGGLIVLHGVATWVIIWSFYHFRYSAFERPTASDAFYPPWSWALEGHGPVTGTILWARDHKLVPEAYLFGFAHTWKMSLGRRCFLNGDFDIHGWWYYFPYAVLVKTPIGMFVILAMAAPAMAAMRRATGGARVKARKRRARRQRSGPLGRVLYRAAPLLVLLGAYWASAIPSHLNIGHRHLLPVYAPTFILAGAAARWLTRGTPIRAGTVGASLLWFVSASLWVRPNYLAYFNELVGGPRNGYKHLVDSSLDWGQDLPALKEWLDAHAGGEPVFLSYFGTARPKYYGIRAAIIANTTWFPEESDGMVQLAPGLYCVSATILSGTYLDPPGPWSAYHEQTYQELRGMLTEIRAAAGDPSNKDHQLAVDALKRWYDLQFARLCAALRQREPDAEVGYSMLIYRVTQQQLRQALTGPPPELRHTIVEEIERNRRR